MRVSTLVLVSVQDYFSFVIPRSVLVSGFSCLLASAQAEFPSPHDSESRGMPMSAHEAAAGFRLPPGFQATVFAAEPEVRQPIAMTFDPRGRLWVAENYTYAESQVNFATQLNDRILIFADTNQDGRFDQRTVFWDQAKILTSIEPGHGGVYVLCPPRLLFLADRNHNDRPDGEPEVLLDGFNTTTGNRHTFANGLKWGSDGWLWGRIGISSGAKIGRPEQPEVDRVEMRGGIWRYHPQRRVFEAVSHGTTNPWGLDWNELGEPFFINTVIGHLWHALPGAHFQRMHGDDVNPRSYVLINQHADHYHFDTGAGWMKSRAAFDGSSFAPGSDQLGGGHAHTGLMIYLGANWPDSYRGRLFTINFHGRRVNQERLNRFGSGYVGHHEPDFLTVSDPWFRGMDLVYGPDGAVFVSDWSDTGECHDHDGVHRSSGRIYRVAFGTPSRIDSGPLSTLPESQLISLLFSRNEWLGRQARRVLSDRAATGVNLVSARSALMIQFAEQTTAAGKLRALWGLNAVGGLSTAWLLERTGDAEESVRSWAVRLLVDAWPLDHPSGLPVQVAAQSQQAALPESATIVARLVYLAKNDPSPLVRLYLASALQRLSWTDRDLLASALLAHAEDAGDHNLPLMLWYGIEPMVGARPEEAVRLALNSRIPIVRELIARRLTEDIETRPAPLTALLQGLTVASASEQHDAARGMTAALRGWRKAPPPDTWATFVAKTSGSSDVALRDAVRDLGVVFGDGRALDDLRAVVLNAQADPVSRRHALMTLVKANAADLAPLLKKVADDNAVRTAALAGLLQLGDPEAPALATGRYRWLGLEERATLLGAMITRTESVRALLEGIATGAIARTDLTPFHARQIVSLGDPGLARRLEEVWGVIRPTDTDKRQLITEFRAKYSPDTLARADLIQGRRLYQQHCAPCHVLYGEGGVVGPDLTGSGRANVDYLLENLLDPSAVVPAEYRVAMVTLKDGRVLNGVLRDPTERTLTILTQTDRITVERSQVEKLEQPNQSMMPEGLLEGLPPDQGRDLLGYLLSPRQVALPANGSP